jgi:hypothetical protein
MEDFTHRLQFDFEKTPQNYFISPMMIPAPFDLARIRNIQNFESPLLAYKDILKTNLSFHEPAGMLPLPKDDDFKLDNADNVKVESTTAPSQHHIEHPQLEISFDSHHPQRNVDNLSSFNHITRSRGPSFHLASGVGEADSIMQNNLDIYSLIQRVCFIFSRCLLSHRRHITNSEI